MESNLAADKVIVSALILMLDFLWADFPVCFWNRNNVISDPQIKISNENRYCSAPIEIPRHTLSSIKDSVKGSFTAVLNLTTDNAPTSPRDKASDDLTTAIKALTQTNTRSKVLPKPLGDE